MAEAGDWQQRQLRLLGEHLTWLQQNSPYYQRIFANCDFRVEELTSIAQLQQLPMTSKSDLAEYNGEFLAVSADEVVDICMTSGTTGAPVTLWQTERDLQRLTRNEETAFRAAGVTASDRVLITAALDRTFMAGLAYFLGLRAIGATVIRGGSGQMAYVAELLRLQRPNVIVGVPSFMLALARYLLSHDIDPLGFGVEKLVCIGEPVRSHDLGLSTLGLELQRFWGGTIFGTYASTEMATSFTDCPAACGGHVLTDLILVEIVDEQGCQLPPGEAGEVVATPLGVEGTPLLRYRTGDIATLYAEPCACGIVTPRLGPVIGRKAHMLKFRGTTLFPGAIGHALHLLPEVHGYYIEVYAEHELSDRIRVVVGARPGELSERQVAEQIAAKTRVKPEVVICTPEEVVKKTIQGDRRKPVTFFDYR